MTKYVKFDEHGICTGEAPFQIEKNGMLIRGYNKPTNEKMLLEDGYVKYDGNLPYTHLSYKDNEIVELITKPKKDKGHTFSKLQIRRSMREINLEDRLNCILSTNMEFKMDWEDSQSINLDDEVFKNAFYQHQINDTLINDIIEHIKE